MKNKKTKELIETTLKTLTNDISLRNVKNHLLLALNELNKIENKIENKKLLNHQQKWQLDLQTGSLINMSLNNYKNALSNIENLISKEENKTKSNDEKISQNLMFD